MSSRPAWVATQVPDQPIFHLKKLIIHDIVFERKPSSIMANLVLHRFDSKLLISNKFIITELETK